MSTLIQQASGLIETCETALRASVKHDPDKATIGL